jgi:hypothetical protein
MAAMFRYHREKEADGSRRRRHLLHPREMLEEKEERMT